ncbi:2TM domain-containing protein [Kangiella sp. TOML190]
MLGWGIGVVFHGLNAFEKLNFFKVSWEKRIAERKLGRKL